MSTHFALDPNDGSLLVGNSSLIDRVFRYDAVTGARDTAFEAHVAGSFSDEVVGPDGNVYGPATNSLGDRHIFRFDAATGASLGIFVPEGSGGGFFPLDLEFGPDGHLYVSDQSLRSILRFDGTTGAFMKVIAEDRPAIHSLAFAPAEVAEPGALSWVAALAFLVTRRRHGPRR